jgi:hypothetical protein
LRLALTVLSQGLTAENPENLDFGYKEFIAKIVYRKCESYQNIQE